VSNKTQRVQPKRSSAKPSTQTTPRSPKPEPPHEPVELEWHLESIIQFATD